MIGGFHFFISCAKSLGLSGNPRIKMCRSVTFACLTIFVSISCHPVKHTETGILPAAGPWRGIIHTQGQEIPFNFLLQKDSSENFLMILKNGEEEILAGNIEFWGDSLIVPLHIFDTELIATTGEDELNGYWRKNYADNYIVPFSARAGEGYRFSQNPANAEFDITGRWEVYFENDSGKKLAIGEFVQDGNQVKGTFLRPSGDYRYLVGEMSGDQLLLSTFDGEHAYLFSAVIKDSSMTGDFYSGINRHERWTATRNENIKLPDPDGLSYLKQGWETIDFELPGMDGKKVSLKNPEYRDKVVIVQIFGTWCANCMDETKFLSEWYNDHKNHNVRIIALAFERKDDFQYAKTRIEKLKQRFNIQYDFLFGGKSDRSGTARALPMLEGSVSFPTTIFIDRHGKVRRIHTGFSGPGTGQHYEEFVADFNTFMDDLLKE